MADDAASSSACTGNLIDISINQDELIMKQQREIEKEVRKWYIAVSARYRLFCFFFCYVSMFVFLFVFRYPSLSRWLVMSNHCPH